LSSLLSFIVVISSIFCYFLFIFCLYLYFPPHFLLICLLFFLSVPISLYIFSIYIFLIFLSLIL
jgi:hypothetical protein